MARVVSLTLFLLSWLLLFSYGASYSTECQVCTNVVDHINQQVQNNEARICPKKVEKVFDDTDVADSCSVKTYLIDELVNRVCYDLYGACTANTPSTEDITGREETSNDAKKGNLLDQGWNHVTEFTKNICKRMREEINKDHN